MKIFWKSNSLLIFSKIIRQLRAKSYFLESIFYGKSIPLLHTIFQNDYQGSFKAETFKFTRIIYPVKRYKKRKIWKNEINRWTRCGKIILKNGKFSSMNDLSFCYIFCNWNTYSSCCNWLQPIAWHFTIPTWWKRKRRPNDRAEVKVFHLRSVITYII